VRSRSVHLTDGEIDVLGGVVRRLTDKRIARELGLSPHTVRDRVTAIRQKLQAQGRAELATLVASSFLLGNSLLFSNTDVTQSPIERP
jgi:DNA-binding CsgD family transcriptional regulator